MYWVCYDDDPGRALIIYAAVAPERYAHEYGYESRQEASEALDAGQDDNLL